MCLFYLFIYLGRRGTWAIEAMVGKKSMNANWGHKSGITSDYKHHKPIQHT